jgi:putative spermidine/putrescine transport system substrate-binding protein
MIASAVLRRRATMLIVTMVLAWPAATQAQTEKELVIATYAGLGSKLWRKVVAEPFTAASGIKTTVFESALPAASVAQSAGKPQFSAAIIANYSAPGLAQKNLIVELTPDDIPNIRQVPERFWPKTPSGTLMGVPIYFSYYGIAFNSELAKASDFQSWNNLLDAKWKGQVSMSRASFVAAYDVTLFSKLNGGSDENPEPGFAFVGKLARNVLTVYTSMASLHAQLGRGEVIAAPFYSNEIAMLKRSGVKNIDIVIPREGGMLLSYLLVIPKGAANIEAAKKLLNAMLEPQYQLGFSEGSGVWPMNVTISLPEPLQKELGGSVKDMMDRHYAPDWYVIGSNLEGRTRRVEEIIQNAK